jgi:YVTN family beta-propeller protein
MLRALPLCLLASLAVVPLAAQDPPPPQGGVRLVLKYDPGARPSLVVTPGTGLDSARAILRRDLDFSDRFETVILPEASGTLSGKAGAFNYDLYRKLGAAYAVELADVGGRAQVRLHDLAAGKVAATLEAGPNMTGVNFAAGKAFVISSTTGFVYVYNMSTLKPAGRIKIGTNVQLETATTDTADQNLYLAESTTNSVVIINAKTEAIERVTNVGLYPWGTHIMDSKDNYCH